MRLFLEFLLIYLVFIITALKYSEARCSGNTRVSYTCYKPQQWKKTHYRRCGWLLRKRCIRYVTYYNRYIKRTCYRYQACPIVNNSVNGGWSSWGSWTVGKCSASCRKCGSSQYPQQRRYRYRSCSNPKPRNGGRSCMGSSYQYTNNYCNTNYCKVNGGWSSWKPLESWGKCSAKCKRCGSSSNPNQTRRRYRFCNNPTPACNGNSCSGSRYITSSKSCNTHYCKVNGGWSSWKTFESWGKCSAKCKKCGSSSNPIKTRRRYRVCNNPTPACNGNSCSGSRYITSTKSCNTHYCKVNGGWSSWKSWESWGKCSEKCRRCGSSSNPIKTRRRYRVCNNPTPACNGNSCSGSRYITSSKSCNTHYCKVNGGWSSWKPWESWGKCSVGSSPNPNQTRRRYRVCNNPTPACNGNSCSGSRYITSSKSCNTLDCTGSGKCDEEARKLSCMILANSNITLTKFHQSGNEDRAYAFNNINDTSNGEKAERSAYPCINATDKHRSPGGSICLHPPLLMYINDIGSRGKVQVNEIAGACHSKISSLHYKGRAVDISKRGVSRTRQQNYIDSCRIYGGQPFDENYHIHCQIVK